MSLCHNLNLGFSCEQQIISIMWTSHPHDASELCLSIDVYHCLYIFLLYNKVFSLDWKKLRSTIVWQWHDKQYEVSLLVFILFVIPWNKTNNTVYWQDIIRLPRMFRFLQKPLAQFISVVRAPKSKEGYASIGGGSPLRQITDAQVSYFSFNFGWEIIFKYTFSFCPCL